MVSSMHALALLSAASAALALRVPYTGVRTADAADYFPHLAESLVRRASAVVDGAVTLNDSKDMSYYIDLTLGGRQFTVQIDTGSSDLWVGGGAVPNSKDTGENGNVTYAKGSAAGPIKTADMVVAGITVSAQAFIEADDDSTGVPGILGLGPALGSVVYNTFIPTDPTKAPPLDRIFSEDSSSGMYITNMLGRAFDDPAHPFPGQITIDEVLPGYEAVLQQPKLEVTGTDEAEEQHWQVLLDADGFMVNGKTVPLPNTEVISTQGTQLTAVFDTGFTLPQLPKSMVDAIYANATGATFDDKNGVYVVPCDAEINVTFVFGGVQYPVHALDTVSPLGGPLSEGCAGTFQPITFDSGGQLDMILGMAFLRNVYMLNAFGIMALAEKNQSAQPYVQLLSTTNDSALAHSEFVSARITNVSSGTGKKSAAVRSRMATDVLVGAMVLLGLASVL